MWRVEFYSVSENCCKFRSNPHRRALPRIAEGFSTTASCIADYIPLSALAERMEAPAGHAFQLSLPYPGGPGLIQPLGLARPQPGLQPAGDEGGSIILHVQRYDSSATT